jgi:hypothetical protein
MNILRKFGSSDTIEGPASSIILAQIISVAPRSYFFYFLELDWNEESANIPGRVHAGHCPEVR